MNNFVISNPSAIAPPGQIISDSELVCRATSLLRWKIRYNSICAEAEKGHVILSGNVDWPSDITTAEQTIRKLSGVLGVTNRIVARPPVGSANAACAWPEKYWTVVEDEKAKSRTPNHTA